MKICEKSKFNFHALNQLEKFSAKKIVERNLLNNFLISFFVCNNASVHKSNEIFGKCIVPVRKTKPLYMPHEILKTFRFAFSLSCISFDCISN